MSETMAGDRDPSRHRVALVRVAGAASGIRHVPVGDGRAAIGVVSIRDVLAVMLGPAG